MVKKKVKIICVECNKDHWIDEATYKSKLKKNQKHFYCSLSCAAKKGNRLYPNKLGKYKGDISSLKGYEANRLDEFSPFKYSLNRARSRSSEREEKTDLTLEYLKELWDNQKGLCAYTKIPMEIPRSSQDHDIKKSPTKLSLDRIESKIGYFKGNVEFVCYCVNVMKNDFSKQEIVDFINKIKSVN